MENKKIGDYVWLYDNCIHKIQHCPELFEQDRFATEKEIKEYNK